MLLSELFRQNEVWRMSRENQEREQWVRRNPLNNAIFFRLGGLDWLYTICNLLVMNRYKHIKGKRFLLRFIF